MRLLAALRRAATSAPPRTTTRRGAAHQVIRARGARSGARDVQQALGADNDFTDPRKAGRHVLEARFALGLNNSAYLGADVVRCTRRRSKQAGPMSCTRRADSFRRSSARAA